MRDDLNKTYPPGVILEVAFSNGARARFTTSAGLADENLPCRTCAEPVQMVLSDGTCINICPLVVGARQYIKERDRFIDLSACSRYRRRDAALPGFATGRVVGK